MNGSINLYLDFDGNLLVSLFKIVRVSWELDCKLDKFLNVFTLAGEGNQFWHRVHLEGIDDDILLSQEIIHFAASLLSEKCINSPGMHVTIGSSIVK